MKLLKIEGCYWCPKAVDADIGNSLLCSLDNDREIDDARIGGIPDWCPLPEHQIMWECKVCKKTTCRITIDNKELLKYHKEWKPTSCPYNHRYYKPEWKEIDHEKTENEK